MKKLLVGLLVLGSFSVFAKDVCSIDLRKENTIYNRLSCSDWDMTIEIFEKYGYEYKNERPCHTLYMKHLLDAGYELRTGGEQGLFFLFIKD
jgi:hypothetical protein